MSGWNELGAMLGGGDGVQRERLREAGMEAGVRQADLLEQARQRRDENLGLQGITPEAVAAAQSDPTGTGAATLVSALLHAKRNPNETATGLQNFQKTKFSGDAMDAALDPSTSLDSLNRRMLVIGGKPVDLSKVEGNVALNPMVSPDSQTMNPTQIGLADMLLKGAQAGAANAAAGEHSANARLADTKTAAGGFAPDHGATKPSLPPIGILGAMLGQGYDKATGLVTIPPEKMQGFLAWQSKKAATDPRYNNGDFAAQHYASEAPLGSGIHDSPADVGAADLTSMMAEPAAASAPAATAAKAAKAPDGGIKKNPDGAYLPASHDDFNALPKGALFINPADGSLRRKQ